MEQYTASNGATVKTAGRRLVVDDFGITVTETDALREFFRAEEDERLGRWRDADFQLFVAYRYNNNWINVVDEGDGTAREHRREDVDACRDNAFPDQSERFARAYFDAHPEPKPWHDAKPGEVWVLRIPTGSTFDHAPAVVSSSANGNAVFTAATYDAAGTEELAPTASQITYATRIWPEDAS